MLVLSRKKEEVIIINGTIRIKVIEIHSEFIKLGIDAPNDVKIHREEVWKSIQEENISAATTHSDLHNPSLPENDVLSSLNKQFSNRASSLKDKK